MSHNWEFALGHVADGWVMFIGDDDGLYPGALELLNELVQSHDVAAFSSNCGGFEWPGHFDQHLSGYLSIPVATSVRQRRARPQLQRVFDGNLPYTRLPWLYNGGGASIDLINRLRDENGRFFCSMIPDVYSAVALSSAVEQYLAIETPVAVNGASRHSTGMSGMRSPWDKEGSPIATFRSEDNIPFHESLVFSKSLQIMLYECYLQSWHIHHGDLGISLRDQLQVAVKVAPRSRLQEVREQCCSIATKNGLQFTATGGARIAHLWRWFSLLKAVFFRTNMVPEQLRVANVYDAAMASAYIHRFISTRSPVMKYVFLTASFLKRALAKLHTALFRSRNQA
jgi:hypothetical protein